MLGMSLSIAAAMAVILVADPVLPPVETRVIVLRCGGQYDPYEVRFNPATYVTQFGPRRFGSRATGDLDHYIEFHINEDAAVKMRIDWRVQTAYSDYSMTQEHKGRTETVDSGICKESKDERPLIAPQAVDIKIVTGEVRENGVTKTPAVVTVSGYINHGDDDKFGNAIDEIKSATVYFESSGGDSSAGIRIGEIIHKKGFHTAVINGAKCMSSCAIAWLGGTKRYIGEFSRVGFHAPFTRRIAASDKPSYEKSSEGVDMIANYVAQTLRLRKDVAGYVTEAPPTRFNMLTQEDGGRVGIEFTRMNIPGHDPLP